MGEEAVIEKILQAAFFPVLHIATLICPKKDDLWLFSAWFGHRFEDSPRAVFEACHKQSKHRIHAYWIYKGQKPSHREIPQEFFVYCYSFRGLYLQLRARVFLLCVNSRDFWPGVTSVRNILVQTWHGTPMKRIGYSSLGGRPIARLKFWVRRFLTDSYDIIVSPNEYTDAVFCDAFKVADDKLLRCEYPRNMAMFLNSELRNSIRAQIAADPSHQLWIYLPTHRSEGRDANGTQAGLEALMALDAKFESAAVEVIFKPHFYEEPFFEEWIGGTAIHKLKIGLNLSLYEILGAVDGLITDYSSVAFDYQARSENIAIFAFDILEFRKNHRDLIRLPADEFKCVVDNGWDLLNQIRDFQHVRDGYDRVHSVDASVVLIDAIVEQLRR